MEPSRFLTFDREHWAALRDSAPLTLSPGDVDALRSLSDPVSICEVVEVYLPLSRLLGLYVRATEQLFRASATFLGRPESKAPYVIGIAGSVAVGKSTTARILQELLRRSAEAPRVDLVTTDGFLYPNRVLEARGLMDRKGFPESYDRRRLVEFLGQLKAGAPVVSAPVYSHQAYDVLVGEHQLLCQPDIVIVEGLNVLQAPERTSPLAQAVVSDFFDFSIYVDAAEADIEQWYVERFLALRAGLFRDPASYFHRFASLATQEAVATARSIWATVNARNLRENILPTRERAHLVLEKGPDHAARAVRLRRL